MTELPSGLAAIIRNLAAGHAGLADRSGRISEHYRKAGASHAVVGEQSDAIAYALSRMPATFAAVSRVLEELHDRAPDFAPATLLDAGAGPGTAAWAAGESFEGLAKTLFDHNREFLALARTIATERSDDAELLSADLASLALGRSFHLVTCAYALTELGDAALLDAADRLWRHAGQVLVIVEPGRPRDYERLMAVRSHLIGHGARVIAPCPHERACPLVAPDWCHFSVRLSRSRDHMRMKGATLGYEDEKFSYLVLARDGVGAPAPARVIRRPEENKFSVTLPLCAQEGLDQRIVLSRDKPAFKAAKKLDWGDAL